MQDGYDAEYATKGYKLKIYKSLVYKNHAMMPAFALAETNSNSAPASVEAPTTPQSE